MAKRTIKPAAGPSRVSTQQATSAARVVYRDSSTGHFVIVEGGKSSRVVSREKNGGISKDVAGKRGKDSRTTSESRTYNIKKR
ncbi:MAG TPA: hypothetical protein VGK04_02320 [Thermoanaerobaculia bacterium]|jgi:hypothetical protein